MLFSLYGVATSAYFSPNHAQHKNNIRFHIFSSRYVSLLPSAWAVSGPAAPALDRVGMAVCSLWYVYTSHMHTASKCTTWVDRCAFHARDKSSAVVPELAARGALPRKLKTARSSSVTACLPEHICSRASDCLMTSHVCDFTYLIWTH